MFDKCQTIRYSEGMVSKKVKTREFLRNFKTLKGQLLTGRVQLITIDVGGDRELEISAKHRPGTGKNLAKMFAALPKPIHIRRIDLFGDLSR